MGTRASRLANQGVRAHLRPCCPRDLYRRRSLIASVISAVKCKLLTRAPGRSVQTQRLQAPLLGLAYDIYPLKTCLAKNCSKLEDVNKAT